MRGYLSSPKAPPCDPLEDGEGIPKKAEGADKYVFVGRSSTYRRFDGRMRVEEILSRQSGRSVLPAQPWMEREKQRKRGMTISERKRENPENGASERDCPHLQADGKAASSLRVFFVAREVSRGEEHASRVWGRGRGEGAGYQQSGAEAAGGGYRLVGQSLLTQDAH